MGRQFQSTEKPGNQSVSVLGHNYQCWVLYLVALRQLTRGSLGTFNFGWRPEALKRFGGFQTVYDKHLKAWYTESFAP